jgi:hypothetical protein
MITDLKIPEKSGNDKLSASVRDIQNDARLHK